MNMANIYAIVVTFNGAKWIDKCLNSLFTSSFPVHIIVVDNASTDNTVEIIKNLYPDVDMIQSSGNLGFGKANNIGIKKALEEGADYFFLLNQDVWIEKSTIETLISVINKNPEIGIISPVHLNGSGTGLDYNFSLCLIPNRCPFFYSDLYADQYNMKPFYEIEFVNAAAWLVSKSCMIAVDGFSPIFDHYGEDEDFVNKAIYAGYKIACSPQPVIYHDRENRKNCIKPFSTAYFDKQRIYYTICFMNPGNKQTFKRMIIKLFAALIHSVYYIFKFKFKYSYGSFKESLVIINTYYKVAFYKERNMGVLTKTCSL